MATVQALNPDGYLGACEIDMTVNPNFKFGSLTINCIGTCTVTHSGTLISVSNSFSASSSSRMDMMFIKLIAKEVHINVLAGHVHIYNGALTQLSDISTDNGDIVYQSLSSFTVLASNNFTFPCLYAPKVVSGSQPKEAFTKCLVVDQTGSGPMPCSVSYSLCTLGDTSCTSSPQMTLKSFRGNVFANLIPEESGYVPDDYQYIMANGTGEILFDKKSNISLTQFNKNFASTALADQMLIVKFGNFECFSTASATFLGATNPAYIAVRPWFMSFFSASLLMGGVSTFTDSPIPGFCPFRTSLTFNDLGEYKSLIMNNIQTPSGKFDISLTYSSNFPQFEEASTKQAGFRGTHGPVQIFDIIPNKDGDYFLTQKNLDGYITLEMTVIVSLLLCFLMGVLFEYILIILLLALLENFMNKTKHLKEYLKRGGDISKTAVRALTTNINSDDIAKTETGNRSDFPIVKLINMLPSQYMLMDLLVRELKGYIFTSSQEFFKLLFIEVEENSIDDTFKPIQYAVIKELYEKICFLNQTAEDDLKSEGNLKYLNKIGFSFETLKDSTTQVLRKVKWVLPTQKKDMTSVPNDISSFEQFFRRKVETTEFDEDMIDFEEFKKKYEAWCTENKLEPIVITRTMLFDIFGVVSDKKEVSFLKRSMESQQESKTYYNVSIDRVEKEIEILKAGSESKKKLPREKGEKKRFDYFPFLLDLISVGSHILVISFLVAIPIILPFFVEVEYNKYSISDYNYGISYDDLLKAPYLLLRKATTCSKITWAFCIIGITYWCFAFIDLLSYYIYTPLRYAGFSEMGKAQEDIPGWAKVIQKISWVYVLLILMVVAMYICLILVWALLGAILNPNAYLAYASGASTLVTFVTAKYSEFMKMFTMGVKGLQDKLMEKFKSFATDMMKKILSSLNLENTEMGKALTDAAQSDDPLGNLKSRAAAVVGNTPLGKQLASFGLDINQAMAIAQGDMTAVAELAAKQGIPPPIVNIIVALVKGNKQRVIECIEEIAKTIQIPPVVVRLGQSMLSINNEKSVTSLVSLITLEWADFIKANLPQGERSPTFDLIKEILPQLILALNDLKKEEEEVFVETLEKMNTYVITAMKKIVEIEMMKDPNAKFKYFTKGDLPKFAIPPFVLNALELHKMYGSEGGQINLATIQKALFVLLETFSKVNKKILSFIFMIINEGLEGSSTGGEQTYIYSRTEQYELIKFIETELGLPSSLLQLIWKIWKEDYVCDQDMIDELTDILKKLSRGIKKDFVKFAFDLLPLMNLTSGKRSIVLESAKFGVKTEYARIVALIGKMDKDFEIIDKVIDGPVIRQIGEKVHISPQLMKGIILFVSGYYSHAPVTGFIEDVCLRAKIKPNYAPMVLSIIVALVSNDCHELLPSLHLLGIKESQWILLGKKMLHPMNIPDKYFVELKLDLEEPAIKFRNAIDVNDKEMWERWLGELKDLLSGYSKTAKERAKKAAEDAKLEGNYVLKEVKKEEEVKEEENEEGKEEGNEEGKEEKKVDVNDVKVGVKEQKEGDNQISAALKDKRERVKRFLNIDSGDTNQELVKELLINCPILPKSEREKINQLVENITKVSQIKDLTWLSDISLMERAMKTITNDLQYEGKFFQGLFDFIHMRSKETFLEGAKNIMDYVLTPTEIKPFMKYMANVYEKQSGLENAERVVGILADKFKIPTVILSKIILPSLRGGKTYQIEDVYLLLNQFGLNVEDKDAFTLNFGNISLSSEDIRYYLSGIVVHDPRAFIQFSSALKVPPSLLALFSGSLDLSPYDKIKKIVKCYKGIATKLGCSIDLYYSVVAMVFLFY